VITQKKIARYFNIIIAVILIIATMINLSALIDNLSSQPMVIALICLTIIYAMANVAKGGHKESSWTGFTRLPPVIAWVMWGLSAATLIILLGTFLAFAYKNLRPIRKSKLPVRQVLFGNLANAGGSILGLHLIYLVLRGTQPILDASGNYTGFITVMIALIGSSAISIALIVLTQPITIEQIIRDTNKYLIPEILVILAGLVLPIIFVQVNVTVFIVILAFIAMQIYRQAQVENSETQLKQRITEMTTLNKLGATIASQLSIVSSLESVYSELNSLLSATTIYIALYDEDQNTLDYRYVVVNGKRVERDKEILGEGLPRYVIREKRAIRYTRAEVRRLFKNIYDTRELTDAQYMIAPLKVSTKVIGILGVGHESNPQAFSEHDFSLFQTITSQASLAIRNATLYDRTVRLADNLSIINQSLQDVMFNLDRDDALRTACQIAAGVTRANKAAIFLLEPKSDNQLRCIESVGFDGLDFTEQVLYQPDIFHDGVQIINDIASSTDIDIIKQAEAGQYDAFVSIPLRSGNTIVGSLNVYHDAPHYYEPPEINLLEMLTNQITAALDNADLLQALELYAAEQAQLVHLSRISGGTLELEQLIYDVCEMLAQMMHVSRAEIGLWNPDKKILRLESPDDVSMGLKTSELDISRIPEIEALLSPSSPGSLRIFNHTEQYPPDLRYYMESNGDATLGMSPMRLNSQTIGFIILGNRQPREFSDNDYRLLEMANHQITVQIHNAQVHTQTEEQLVNRLEQLALIEDIARQISEALELDIIIQNVLEASLQSTQANFASIALIERDAPRTFDIIWREVVGDRLVPDRITLEMEDGVVGEVVNSGEMLIIPENDDFDAYFPPTDASQTFRSTLAVPMITGNKVIGVLNLESVEADFFTMEQASFIKSLAGHAAISIDNANLLVERERQINILTLLRELSLDALSVIHPEDIVDAVLRTALILLEGDETAIYRYNKQTHQLMFSGGVRSDQGQIVTAQPIIPQTILEEAIQKMTLQFVPDIHQSQHYQDFADYDKVSHNSIIIMPVARRQQIHEILCIAFNDVRKFSHNDFNIVDLLAVQVAGHLENASLNEEITANNDRMRAILDSTRDGIILLNNDGRIQDVNDSAIRLTGNNLNNHLFKPLTSVAQLDGHSDESASAWQKIVDAYQESPDKVHNTDYAFVHGDGEDDYVQVKLLVNRVEDETGDTIGHLLIFRDITEENKLQGFRDTMQSMVLHDLRGPLTAIVTSMYVAENILALYNGDFEDLKQSLTKTFKVSLSSSEDMLRQVDTLRDLPMMARMQVKPQALPMYDIAEIAYSSLSANFEESEIDIELDIEPKHLVFVDESLIRRVVVNLLHNAYKFTPEKGKVLIRLLEDGKKENYVCIQIADTGPGIPEDQRDRIFGQYIQIEDNNHRPRAGGKGTGLGLNFCKLAVEAHGGQIWVEADSPLSGGCFSFTLPITDWRPSSSSTDDNAE